MGNQLRFFICDYTFSMSSQLETRLPMSHKKAHCHYPSAVLFCVFFFFLIFAWQWLLSSKRFALAKISFLHFSQSVAAYLQLSWLILKAGSGLPIKYLKRTFGWYYSLLVCFLALYTLDVLVNAYHALWSNEPSNIAYDLGVAFSYWPWQPLPIHPYSMSLIFNGSGEWHVSSVLGNFPEPWMFSSSSFVSHPAFKRMNKMTSQRHDLKPS